MVNNIDLKEVFRGLQDQMEAKLTFNRKVISHPGAKGSVSELEWIEMLGTYLPKRYCVDTGFVVDHEGTTSEQIDILIYDRQYSPFILKQNGVSFIPAECVYALIEVKQTLEKKHIEYAQKKARSVRKLKRTSMPIVHAGGTHDPKPPARILAGLVSLEGKLTKKMREKLETATPESLLDFGCSLNGDTYFSFPELHPWEANAKPYKIDHKEDKNSLVNFFMYLVAGLQKIGTVPALDIRSYLK